jgi:hypothetical protein
MSGFVAMSRDSDGDALMEASPLAFVLAAVIAKRARWSDGFNEHNLGLGEALLGDFRRYGMTEQQYRTAKCQLTKWKFATFKATTRGTIAKLTDSRLFDVLRSRTNGQNNGHETDKQRTRNGRLTTNEDLKKEQDGKAGKEKTLANAMVIEICEAYPRREARQAALKAIARALRKIPADQLLAKTKAYADHCRKIGKQLQYMPYAATWFNGERWNDPLIEPTPQPQRPPTKPGGYAPDDWRSAL